MALTSYVVLSTGEGWTVFQDGEPLEQRGTKAAAAEVAHLLATQAQVFGVQSRLFVQDVAGELEAWDLDAGPRMLAALFARRRPSTAEA